MKHAEDEEQRVLVQWAKLTRLPRSPDVEEGAVVADYLFAIPNGGKRVKLEAARMSALGVKAGVSDLELPIARGGHFGLWLEMKRKRSDFRGQAEAERAVSDSQRDWGRRMKLAGYRFQVAYGFEEAQAIINDYINQARTIPCGR